MISRPLACSLLVKQRASCTAGVFAGVTAYTWHDVNFTTIGYVWIVIWYIFAVFEMVYIKKVVDTVEMTTWSRTYYQVISRCIVWPHFLPLCRMQSSCQSDQL